MRYRISCTILINTIFKTTKNRELSNTGASGDSSCLEVTEGSWGFMAPCLLTLWPHSFVTSERRSPLLLSLYCKEHIQACNVEQSLCLMRKGVCSVCDSFVYVWSWRLILGFCHARQVQLAPVAELQDQP